MSMSAPESAEGPHGLGWLLSHQAAREPNRPAYSLEGQTWTRGEIDAPANRMARALGQPGIRQDDMVVVLLPNGVAHHVFTFAIWKLGATPLPLAYKMPDIELR